MRGSEAAPGMRRTALFGGTFDPIHLAHLEIARAAADRFDLAKVLFVPAANPPHKPDGATAPYEDRVRMTELACAPANDGGDARFEVSRIEAGWPRSYSILTIEKLRTAVSGRLNFLIGADAFAEIRTWHRWREIVASVDFIVVTRPGAQWEIPPGARVFELTGIDLSVSSSEIRTRIASGDLEVPLPKAVLGYILEHGIYQSQMKKII
jgi:nicotinate-nucleotide adenylyltransferase